MMHVVVHQPNVIGVEFDDGDRLALVTVPPGGVPFEDGSGEGLAVALCSPVKPIERGSVTWRHTEITAAPGERYAWAWIADDSDAVLAVIDNNMWVRQGPPAMFDVTVST